MSEMGCGIEWSKKVALVDGQSEERGQNEYFLVNMNMVWPASIEWKT